MVSLWDLFLYQWLISHAYILTVTLVQGSGGATIKKTNMALIIGIYNEPLTPGQCNMIVERLGDYLIDQGF